MSLYKNVGNKNWVDLCDEEMTKEVLIWIDIWWIKRRKEIRYDIDKDLVGTYLEKTMQPLQLLQLLQPSSWINNFLTEKPYKDLKEFRNQRLRVKNLQGCTQDSIKEGFLQEILIKYVIATISWWILQDLTKFQ